MISNEETHITFTNGEQLTLKGYDEETYGETSGRWLFQYKDRVTVVFLREVSYYTILEVKEEPDE